ncbi:MAG: UbiD family decarboxylase, partial [Candidatus Rokubacteria bacterium]|nr:UbiD family decarboxylase [Candidatus Rokubacteria bacterium]
MSASRQGLRAFVAEFEQARPGEVLRISEPIAIEYDVQAIALELERRRRFPVLLFEQIRGFDTPVVANVMASRAA